MQTKEELELYDPTGEDLSTKKKLAKWIAVPKSFREHKTQKELAKALDITEVRLSQIKWEEGFWNLVNEYRKEFFKNETSEVVQAIFTKATKGEDPRAQKLFLQLIKRRM